MFRLLISLVTMGAVISCSMEDTESSGVLVNPNSEQEVPDWLTISDVDLNSDGTIDIRDLVIAAKFLGQDVPKPVSTEDSDESEIVFDSNSGPCQDIDTVLADVTNTDLRKLRAFKEAFQVYDNTDFKEFFAAPNDSRYVYALIATHAHIKLGTLSWRPICIAVRFQVNDGGEDGKDFDSVNRTYIVQNLKIKMVSVPSSADNGIPSVGTHVTAHLNDGVRTSTDECSLVSSTARERSATGGIWPLGLTKAKVSVSKSPPSHCGNTYRDPDFNQFAWDTSILRDFEEHHTRGGQYKYDSVMKRGIPIGEDKVISSFAYWYQAGSNKKIVWASGQPWNIYLKVLPSEVRSIYFPEDK